MTPKPGVADYRCEATPTFKNSEENSNFVFAEAPQHIHTPFFLLIQGDGYVINPAAWTNEFLEYDYIGAKWPWHTDGHNVGNGGFCLRSRKLCEVLVKLLASKQIALPDKWPEDDYVCRKLRPILEANGIRFAPEEVADRFSYERANPTQSTFGFHGPFNMWRHMDYSELPSVIDAMDDYVVKGKHYAELMNAYHSLGKFELVDLMMKRRDRVLAL